MTFSIKTVTELGLPTHAHNHLFIHPFNKYTLSAWYVLGMVDKVVNEQNTYCHGAYIPLQRQIINRWKYLFGSRKCYEGRCSWVRG